jgi:mRNA interferase MazF
MERFVKGDIVVIPFPFSDLSGSKKRPALVLADLQGDDIILCQITSQQTKASMLLPLMTVILKPAN